jgi:hypothetical protein
VYLLSLSGEDIELADPRTPWRRKLAIRLRRTTKFMTGTTILVVATVLICVFMPVLYFGYTLLLAGIFGFRP